MFINDHILTGALSSSCLAMQSQSSVVSISSSPPFSHTWPVPLGLKAVLFDSRKWRVNLVVDVLKQMESHWSCLGLFLAKRGWTDSRPGASCPGWAPVLLYQWSQATCFHVSPEWWSQSYSQCSGVCQQCSQEDGAMAPQVLIHHSGFTLGIQNCLLIGGELVWFCLLAFVPEFSFFDRKYWGIELSCVPRCVVVSKERGEGERVTSINTSKQRMPTLFIFY